MHFRFQVNNEQQTQRYEDLRDKQHNIASEVLLSV